MAMLCESMIMNLNSSTNSCPICKKEGSEAKNLVYKCSTCHLLYKDTSLYKNSLEEKNRYDFHKFDKNDVNYINQFKELFLEYIDPYLKRGVFLDFGSGKYSVLLTQIPDTFEKHEYDLYYHNDLNYLNRHYDIIVLTEVIEHLKDPLSVLSNLTSLLKKNGYLLIKTMFYPEKIDNWWYLRDITHYTFYNYDTFCYLANALNLKIIKTNQKDIILLQK